jgi:hypothetical protein
MYYQENKYCLDSFTEFIVHQQRRAVTFAQQVSLFDLFVLFQYLLIRLFTRMSKVFVVIRIKLLFDLFMINYLHDQSKMQH